MQPSFRSLRSHRQAMAVAEVAGLAGEEDLVAVGGSAEVGLVGDNLPIHQYSLIRYDNLVFGGFSKRFRKWADTL
jgi:hypothetical protein